MTFPVPTPTTGALLSEAMGDSWGNAINYLQTVVEGPATGWTPVLNATTTNPTGGTGSNASGSWKRIGEWVFAEYSIKFGTSGVAAGAGFYQMTVPTPLLSITYPVGWGYLFDASATSITPTVLVPVSTTALRFGLGVGYTTSAVPWTWAANDSLAGTLMYRAA